ncbi:arginine:ornithine antiporter, partial [Enterocloster clostridioformis]|nr:arginine:ornithine antiporter [Enterocloster clostridioformis]
SLVTLICLEIAVYFLIRPGFRKSNQGAWKRKNILKIIFDVVIVLSAILLACDLFGLRFSSIQSELARLSFSLGNIGEIWISDISRKAKNIYIALLIIAVVFIVIDLVRFI